MQRHTGASAPRLPAAVSVAVVLAAVAQRHGVCATHSSTINGVACNHPPYWTVGRDVYVTEDSFNDRYVREGAHWGPMIHDGQGGLAGNVAGYPGNCPNPPVLRNPRGICTCAANAMTTVCPVNPPAGTWCPTYADNHACKCRQSLEFRDVTITPGGIVCGVTLRPCWVDRTNPACLQDNFAQCRDQLGNKRYGVDLEFELCPCGFGTVTVCATLCDDKFATQEWLPISTSLDCDDEDCAPSLCFNIHVEQVNDCPSFVPVPVITVDEDHSTPACHRFATNVNYGCANEGPNGAHEQEIYFRMSCDNDALFKRPPDIEYKQGDNTADLCFSTAPDRSGCSVCTISIYDTGGVGNGGCDTGNTAEVRICVNEINDPPTFEAGSTTLTVDEDGATTCSPSGCSESLYTYQNWATLMAIGPGWEACAETDVCCQPESCNTPQSLVRFEVTFVDFCDRVLFEVLPAVDITTGDLTFTLAQHANTVGSYKVDLRVVLVDSGKDSGACLLSAANLGCHQADSTPLVVTLIIKSENDAPSFTPAFTTLQLGEDEVFPATAWAGDLCIGGARGTGCADAPCTPTCLADAACCTARPCPCDFCNEASAPESQQFVWQVEADNKELFTAAGQPAVSAAGLLTFTLERDVNGVARVRATLKDDGGAFGNPAVGTTTELVVSVEARNDQPTFTLPATHSVAKCTAACTAQAVAQFVTDIDSGSDWTDEDPQTLQWVSNTPAVNNDNPALFEVQPWLEMSGDRRASTLHYTLKPGAAGSARVTVILQDNGRADDCAGTACAVCNGGAAKPRAQHCNRLSQTFVLTVADSNTPPTFTVVHPFKDVTVREDPVPATITIAPYTQHSAGDAVEDTTQTVTYTATPADSSLFTAGGQPAIDASGALTFTPAPDAYGKTALTIKATDNGVPPLSSAEQVVMLTITPVNDAPSFTSPAALPASGAYKECTTEAGCPVSVPFASAIQLGPANEAAQAVLAWSVSCPGHTDLLSGAQLDTATGELSFMLRQGRHTQGLAAACSATLRDNGGTASGGGDSFTAQFSVSVTADTAPPTFAVRSSGVMREDDPPKTFRQALASIASSTQPVTATCGAGSTLVRLCTADPTTGDIAVHLHAELYGEEQLAVSLCNPGGCTAAAFLLQVLPVNDAPSHAPFPDLVVLEAPGVPSEVSPAGAAVLEATELGDGSHYYRIAPAAPPAKGTSTAAGVATEAEQTLAFAVSPATVEGQGVAAAVFATLPRIAPGGELSFTTRGGAGAVPFAVRLSDNGGTLHGGVDRAPDQALQIEVRHFNTPPRFQLLKNTLVFGEAAADTPVTAEGVLSGVSPGAFDEEITQRVAATLACGGSGGCAGVILPGGAGAAPSVDTATGVLSMKLAAHRSTPPSGCVCEISLSDDGPQGPPGGHRHRSAPQNITLVVTGVNDPPSFPVGPDQTTPTDTTLRAPRWIDPALITAGPFEDVSETLAFTATPADPSLLAQVTLDPASGDLQVVPRPGRTGRTTVTLCLRDSEGGETCKADAFTVTVLDSGVAGVPGFSGGGDVTVEEDSPPYVGVGWATGMRTGDPTDATRILRGFEATTTQGADLFAPGGLPKVDLQGGLSFTLLPDANGEAVVLLRLLEANGISSPPQQLRIVVRPVDDPPAFTLGPAVEVAEDSPPYDAPWCTALSAGAPDEPLSSLAFAATPGNTALFARQPEVVVQGGVCRLTFTPMPDASGSTEVRVTLSDASGQPATATASITILPVNDAPTWMPGNPTVYLQEDFGAATKRGIATALYAGAPDEAAQLLSVEVEVLQGGDVFAATPAASVSASGGGVDLLLRSRPDASGAAVLSLRLRDSGGTASGGADASPPWQLRVVVRPENDPPSLSLASRNVTLLEDTPLSVPGFAAALSAGPGEVGQRVVLRVAGGDAAVFAMLALDASGELSVVPQGDAFGVSDVAAEATDFDDSDAAHTPLTTRVPFGVVVLPVNDPPSFAVAQGAVSAEAGIPQTAQLLSNIAAGPPNEAGQAVSIVVSPDDASLFSVQPSVTSPQGVLSFTAARAGQTTLRLHARDDGGTASSGRDTSDTRSVAVVVTARTTPGFALTQPAFTISSGDHTLQVARDIVNVTGTPRFGLQFDGTDGVLLFREMPSATPDGRVTLRVRQGVEGTAHLLLDLTDTASGAASPAQRFSVTVAQGDAPQTLQVITATPPGGVTTDAWRAAIAAAIGAPPDGVTIRGLQQDDTGKTGGSGSSVIVGLDYSSAESGRDSLMALANNPASSLRQALNLTGGGGDAACVVMLGSERCFAAVPACSAYTAQGPCDADARCLFSQPLQQCQERGRGCAALAPNLCEGDSTCILVAGLCVAGCAQRKEAGCSAPCVWDAAAGVCAAEAGGGGGGLPAWVIPVCAGVGAVLALAGLAAYCLWRRRRGDAEAEPKQLTQSSTDDGGVRHPGGEEVFSDPGSPGGRAPSNPILGTFQSPDVSGGGGPADGSYWVDDASPAPMYPIARL